LDVFEGVDFGGGGVYLLLLLGGGVDVCLGVDLDVVVFSVALVGLGGGVLLGLALELVRLVLDVVLSVELVFTLKLEDGGGVPGAEHPTSKKVYGDMGFGFVLSPAGTSKRRQFASP